MKKSSIYVLRNERTGNKGEPTPEPRKEQGLHWA